MSLYITVPFCCMSTNIILWRVLTSNPNTKTITIHEKETAHMLPTRNLKPIWFWGRINSLKWVKRNLTSSACKPAGNSSNDKTQLKNESRAKLSSSYVEIYNEYFVTCMWMYGEICINFFSGEFILFFWC